jgi:hypothetical protein
MLTIENLKKIQGRSTAGNWVIKEVGELTHNDSYYFGLYQIKAGVGAIDRCNIMLERNSIVQRSSTHPDESAYFFICDSQRTNTCGTADWLADIDNVLGVMEYLIENVHIKL